MRSLTSSGIQPRYWFNLVSTPSLISGACYTRVVEIGRSAVVPNAASVGLAMNNTVCPSTGKPQTVRLASHVFTRVELTPARIDEDLV